MKKLFYEHIIPPKRIKIKSLAFKLDFEIESDWTDEENPPEVIIGVDDLFALSNSGLFESIMYYVEDDMTAYYRDGEGRKNLHGWIEITDYEKGGECGVYDELYWIEKH